MGDEVDRWLNKNTEIDEVELIIGRSIEGLKAQSHAHQGLWGFGNHDRWDVNLDTGFIKFSSSDGSEATAPVQVAGTYNTLDNTFLWAWDHPYIPKDKATASLLARAFGEKFDLADYINHKIECDEAAAWEFAAVTNYLAEMQGVYRGPSGSTFAFLVFGDVTLSQSA